MVLGWRGWREGNISVKWDGVDGLGIMVIKELCEKVVDVRRMIDRVMALVLIPEEDVLRLICGYALHGENL